MSNYDALCEKHGEASMPFGWRVLPENLYPYAELIVGGGLLVSVEFGLDGVQDYLRRRFRLPDGLLTGRLSDFAVEEDVNGVSANCFLEGQAVEDRIRRVTTYTGLVATINFQENDRILFQEYYAGADGEGAFFKLLQDKKAQSNDLSATQQNFRVDSVGRIHTNFTN